MEDGAKIPLPLEPIKLNEIEDRRLWVGNLDLRINEYQLLRIVQKYGNIEKFDLLFHRFGPQAGQPRGYAFVTYKRVEDAEVAKDALNNLRIGAKNMVVRYAHSVTETELEKPKQKIDIPALAGAKLDDNRISRETAIQAIEAKLKLMKECQEEFELNKPLEGAPIIQMYQKSSNQKSSNQKPSSSARSYNRGNHRNSKPYSRHNARR
ncbi:probable RNA-binding protein 18 isoform X2 [Prorops nasuta]|uniref:probable RNA-binding protein 18 isoform X1 n=1 Tax=Prorops nasuta TaxID=863751 RepID=UPI0034CD1DBD